MASAPNVQKKWEQLLQATLLENQSNSFAEKLSASASKANVGAFTKFVFPMVRKTYPALVSSQLVSVQPMTGPIGGAAFYNKWKKLVGDDEEPPFKLDIPIQSLFTRKLKDGSERKIVGLITKIGENKEAEPFAVVEDAQTGESFTFYFHEIEKVSLLVVVAAASK